ncbi:beta-galactosidase, partial [Candidatus Bathyarchaeota archaeon]|nr:beta-galactosidase [Candidatus Bathyarchaeota archaeon]
MINQTHGTVTYDAKSFTINGQRVLLVGGEFHYFRTPNALWEDRLIKMRRSGANLVTTYIPWNWHEPVEGQQDWRGDRDLGRFIELCAKHGFYVIVKPGPYCCAELDFGGHPDWLLGKQIRLRELDALYLDYVERWYKRVAEVIHPYLVTNGGNIFCIQLENEYDHLIDYGESKITLQDAITYFEKLQAMMNKYGIDIPKFANEANFLRGRGIIDTRTYYPNIPFFKEWEWLFEHFDDKIIKAKVGQPDCPTMIMELQVGWFGMFGREQYYTDLALTEAVSKSVLMEGASVLNYYIYVGGTTFPFWGCRGNIMGVALRDNDYPMEGEWAHLETYPLETIGMGLTTSFDFGGSPIREWGELMPGRYDWLKAFNMFVQDYADLLYGSDNVDDLAVVSGGESIKVIGQTGVTVDTAILNPTDKFGVITKKRGTEYLAGVRNLGDAPKMVAIGWTHSGEPIIRDLEVRGHESCILPIQVRVPGTDLTIIYATSELLFHQPVGSSVWFGLYGKAGRPGEMVLDVPASQVQVLTGNVSVSGDDGGRTTLCYTHQGIQVVLVGAHRLFILEQELAGKVEKLDQGILIANTYFVREIQHRPDGLSITTEMRPDSENTFDYFGSRMIATARVDGQPASVENGPVPGHSRLTFHNPPGQMAKIAWLGGWKVRADTAEVAPDYDDSGWTRLAEPVALEKAGLLEHGYIWYRAEFELPEGAEGLSLVYPGNNTDRQYIYVNGHLVWNGIKSRVEVAIQQAARPGKNVIAVLYQNFYHNKSHPHEGALIKYSGIMQPLVVQGRVDGRDFIQQITSFAVRQHLHGVLQAYARADFDDAGWQEVEPGHKYLLSQEMGVVLWMRRKFTLQVQPGCSFAFKLTIPKAEHRCL